jgi:hypothetical protein
VRFARGSGGLLRSDYGPVVTPQIICVGVPPEAGEKAVLGGLLRLPRAIGAVFLPVGGGFTSISGMKPASLRAKLDFGGLHRLFLRPDKIKKLNLFRRRVRPVSLARQSFLSNFLRPLVNSLDFRASRHHKLRRLLAEGPLELQPRYGWH